MLAIFFCKFQIGGATAKIGDPSGKTVEREELSHAYVDDNAAGIKTDIERIFSNHERIFCNYKTEKLAPIK